MISEELMSKIFSIPVYDDDAQERTLALFGESDSRELMDSALKDAVASESSYQVAVALRLVFIFGIPPNLIETLCYLANKEWHRSHEDIASLMQDIGDPRAVDSLVKLATWALDYLEWDDNRALGRKAVWALSATPGDAARKALQDLCDDPDPLISELAKERLFEMSESV